jgi:hypothetical protein
MNLTINRKSPLLQKGEYTCKVVRYHELENDTHKSVLTIEINDRPYQVWLDETRQITLNDGTVTTPAQLVFDAIVSQCSDEVLDTVSNDKELFTVLVQEQATLKTWVTVFEDRLNNFSFFKPKTWDAEQTLGL